MAALAVMAHAGPRSGSALPQKPLPPPLSPPLDPNPPQPSSNASCYHPHPTPAPAGPHGFTVEACDATRPSQHWSLSPGVGPRDYGKATNLQSAAGKNAGCAEVTGCSSAENADIGCGYGCKPLPPAGDTPAAHKCDFNGVWKLMDDGTIRSGMDGHCLALSGGRSAAVVAHSCTRGPEQQWSLDPVSNSSEAAVVYRLRASGASSGVWCLDNHYSP